eukprot:TRINITY_DN908_c0_g1_i2.p1 TRINITY_DN908_c0_g1~~TRINITY_DN908_c0_g1_i2.p1  ORF type:complete len:189 (+),score=25.94 TRINITY_DN908_c0_g1_i2:131-697(+)
MSLAKYGFAPIVRQPTLTIEEYHVLEQITDVMEKLDNELARWGGTNAHKTIRALQLAKAIVLGLSTAVTADSHRLERVAAAIFGKDLKSCVKAVRCPRTNDPNLKASISQLRKIVRTNLGSILQQLWTLFDAEHQIEYQKFINVNRTELLAFLQTEKNNVEAVADDEDFIEEGMQVIIPELDNNTMYT